MKPSKETQSVKNPKRGMNAFRDRKSQQLLGRCYDAAVRFVESHTKYGKRYLKSEMYTAIYRVVGFAPTSYAAEVIKLLVENKIITATPRDFTRFEIKPVERKPLPITLPPSVAAGASKTPARIFHPCPDAPATAAQVADLSDGVSNLRALVVALAIDVQRLIELNRK